MNYKLLTWDIKFFNTKTGRIIPSSLREKQLVSILAEMRREEYQLVYWASEQQNTYELQAYSSMLVDKKTTFEINLQNINLGRLPLPKAEPYCQCNYAGR